MTYTFIELNGTTRRIKRNNAKKIMHHYEQIGPKTFRRLAHHLTERKGLQVTDCRHDFGFDYDYPQQFDHPELALIPAMRYPVQQAQRNLESFR